MEKATTTTSTTTTQYLYKEDRRENFISSWLLARLLAGLNSLQGRQEDNLMDTLSKLNTISYSQSRTEVGMTPNPDRHHLAFAVVYHRIASIRTDSANLFMAWL